MDLSKFDVGLMWMHMDVLPRHATWCGKNMKNCVTKHKIITNKGKKERTIYSPNKALRWVQSRLKETVLDNMEKDDAVHGFVKGRGCITNARVHVDSGLLINIDIKDFFPTITSPRVYGFFKSTLNVDKDVATSLTKVTTYDDHLCQGFITSPDIANLITWKLDRRLKGLAKSMGLRYTRYADDLTFSAKKWTGDASKIVMAVREISGDEGFPINEKKVAIMRRGRRQKVTGLVVSEHGVNVPRRTRMLLRAACHHWPQQTPERKASIVGWLSYLKSVNPKHASDLESIIAKSIVDTESREWDKSVSSQPFEKDITGRIH